MADSGSRPAGLSLRWQLTLSYAAFVVLVGVVLFAVGLLLLRFVPEGNLSGGGEIGFIPDRTDLMTVFTRYAIAGLVFLAALGVGGGWLLAGRMLRGVDRITAVAERVRAGDLGQRVDWSGRSNELSDLADTFDAMVARIESAMDEQRRFAANASHELRTPHAVTRTIVEVARADPERDVDRVLDRIEEINERSIVMTEALLDLAQADQGVERSESVDLAALVAARVGEMVDASAQLDVNRDLRPATVSGDPVLLSMLVANLVQNAAVHNHPGGWISVATRTDGRDVVLEVGNTGPVVDDAIVATLTEPFLRAAGRVRSGDGSHAGAGLGLAIVASIVRAHDGRLDLQPRRDGGLTVRIRLAAA